MTDAILPPRWRSVLVLCAVAALGPVLLVTPHGLPPTAGRAVAAVLALVQAGAVWWMGTRPVLVSALVIAAGCGIQILYPEIGPGVALVVVSTLAWTCPARVSLCGLGGIVLASTVASAVDRDPYGAALWFVAGLLAWSWGALGRARAEGRRQLQAERERRAVLEERARIARELHDVLSHTVSVMVVQASAADDVFDQDPEGARRAVRSLEETGRHALAELRGLMWSVRPAGEGDAEDAPQPRLSDLDALVRSVSAAGLDVDLRRDGLDGTALPTTVELSAYRIVQESLTNVLRHARARTARVDVRGADGWLTVDVHDDGVGRTAGTARPGSGNGLVGMRERARLAGGTLEAGPDLAGGFRVRARLPIAGPDAAEQVDKQAGEAPDTQAGAAPDVQAGGAADVQADERADGRA